MKFLARALRGLVAEQKDGHWEASKGNMAFWAILVHAMVTWSNGATVPDGELYTLWALLGYAGVKQVRSAYTADKNRKKIAKSS
jgi:hypothetical protein